MSSSAYHSVKNQVTIQLTISLYHEKTLSLQQTFLLPVQAHLVSSKGDLDIGVYQISCLPCESFLHVS